MNTLKWIKRILMALLLIIFLLLMAGFVFERISRSIAEKIKPDGQFAEVENHKMHYLQQGKGGPTVVFETAFDPAGHLQWYHIQQNLPKSYTTFSYDRSGILWSERGANPKTGEKMAEELHTLLEKSKAPKPYILVGHSFGGMLTRFFVQKYPKDVAGVILVDSQYPADEKYLSPQLYKMVNQGLPGGFLKFANTFGAARLMFKNMFPENNQYQYQNSVMPALLYKSADATLEEQDHMKSVKTEAAAINTFGSVPLYVITAGDKTKYDSFIKDQKIKNEMLGAWDKMQKDLLNLSTDSKQIIAEKSGHYINQDQPEVIEKAVNDMVEKVSVQ
ncbi:alpha/beta hydrolase [Chryseobacterium oranimense]|uniref:Pimeloyl-ACP methyl ester carboxylesterase n=1 Tax=Chryseobacterium oranimense TaxID=421058 RepID=A0A1M5T0I0_9FLAO|nr:alpha/beta hydrolase [Chryseobacterium oranimense]SHH44128.1 Pimeloyl-ACP methyl ester carboxylesterase [Chryseobacterium oranimense]